MDNIQLVRIDGIKWWMSKAYDGGRLPIPLCPIHDLKMTPFIAYGGYSSDARSLICAEGHHHLDIPRKFTNEKQYVIDRVDAKVFKNMKVINLDDEAVPIAESAVDTKNNNFFITARMLESKRGIQLVLYAGEKGKTDKSQIFIEPDVKRLDFDRNDIHPDEVFVKITATFRDGSEHSIEKKRKNEHPKN